MSSQWNDDQAAGDRALREHKRRSDLDSALCAELRACGVRMSDAQSAQAIVAVQAVQAETALASAHRIISALRAVEAWLREVER